MIKQKAPKLKPGDLVTRTYDYQIDSIPDAGKATPYGIVLEVRPEGVTRVPNVVVYWFKEESAVHANKTRINSARFLRLVNSADSS